MTRTQSSGTEKQKKEIIDQLQKTPIVQLACERVGVGRSTYYQWRKLDKVFARAADRSLEAGTFFVNDVAESKLLSLIQSGNLTAIIFWLKSRHPKFANVNRMIHEYEIVTDRMSVEERNVIGQELAKMMAARITPKFTAQETKEAVEAELDEKEAK